MSYAVRQVLGIRFFDGTTSEAVEIGLRGGLVVVPAAPALVALERDRSYREALVQSDLAITDSGFMVLLWFLRSGERLSRVSGLAYLRILLKEARARRLAPMFWIMPSTASMQRTQRWLDGEGLPWSHGDFYVAPQYAAGVVDDDVLLRAIGDRRPQHIIVALGGGTQERLGLFLKTHIAHRPGIHCIGAAIGFLTGDQVTIPVWADRLVLGWLFRCLSDPRKFVPRYWRATDLVRVMWRYGHSLPQL